MPSYFRITFFLLLLASLSFCTEENHIENDLLTVIGLDMESNSDFGQSGNMYLKLFKKTNNSDYLKKALDSYMKNQDFEKVIELSTTYLKTNKEIEEYLLTQLVASSILTKQYSYATPFAKELKEKYPTPIGLGLSGDLNYILGDFEGAKKDYEKAYESMQNVNLLMALSNVLYTKLDNKKKAIRYLREFTDKNGCNDEVCTRLLEYYQENKDLLGMINVIEKLYDNHKKTSDNEKLAKIELILGELYVKVDTEKAINFLIKTGRNNLYLATIYENKKEYEKAIKLLNSIYENTKDKSILGQIAMVNFEMAKNKKLVLKDVFEKFELALSEKSNAQYENFYGYLLIDYDLDIKKGLELVKKASLIEPNDIAILDSLAWGYFKNNECDLAYKYINQVVEKVGLEDEEIKLHHKKIKECFDKNNNKQEDNK